MPIWLDLIEPDDMHSGALGEDVLEPWARKLQTLAGLDQADIALLAHESRHVRRIEPGRDIISEGADPSQVCLILSGFAFRYKLTEKGERQVFAYLIPGDFSDLHVFLLRRMDHSIGTIGPCLVADVPRRVILELTEKHL